MVIPFITAHTASGTVAQGCRALTFVASADFSGTVLGMPLPAGAGVTIPVPHGETLGPVAYTCAAGTLYSIEVR